MIGRTWAGLLAVFVAAAPVEGQIVNTLRGWAEPDSGWSGEVRGQVALSEGNAEYFELTLGGAAQVTTGRHRVRALTSETLRRAGGEKVAESLLLHLRHNLRLRPWLASLAFAQLQYNPFRRLERRTLLGLGARFDIVRAEAWDAALGVSGMLERERITDRSGTETEGRASYFVSVVGRVAPHVRLDTSGFWQPRFAEPGDARAFLEAGVRVDLVGGLGLLVALDLEHDSDPPEGVEETDLTLASGLVLEF